MASPGFCICQCFRWPCGSLSLEGRGAQGGGWQGRREGGTEVGRRERGGGRLSSAAPSLVSAGWRWLRVPLRWRSVSASPPALAPERGGEPQPGAAVGVSALKDAFSRSRVCRRRPAAPARAAAASSGVPRRRCSKSRCPPVPPRPAPRSPPVLRTSSRITGSTALTGIL